MNNRKRTPGRNFAYIPKSKKIINHFDNRIVRIRRSFLERIFYKIGIIKKLSIRKNIKVGESVVYSKFYQKHIIKSKNDKRLELINIKTA